MLKTRRERIILGGGAPCIALLLYFALWPAEEAEALPEQAPPQAAAPAPLAAASPPAQAPAAPPQAPDQSTTAALRLYGVLGGGLGGGSAIFGSSADDQRLVEVGRDVAPGLRLHAVARDHVLLETASGLSRLRLGGGALAAVAPAAQAAAAIAPASGASHAPTAQDAVRYHSALAPRRIGDRTTGYTVRANASLPLLQQAGLRPGDVLVSVNGQSFDSDERVLELSREIAGSHEAVFEFEREGRRMQATLPVNPRPQA